MSSLSIRFYAASLRAQLSALEGEVNQAARPAAQAGAQVLYEAVQRNVAGLKKHTGNLARSIYQAYSENNSVNGRQVYHVSWNARKAPHGHLVEFGYLQRYELVRDARGRFCPAVRPEAQGKPKPGRRASQAVKDAYWVPRAGGPVQIPGKSFVRGAAAQLPQAQAAMEQRFFAELAKKGVVR